MGLVVTHRLCEQVATALPSEASIFTVKRFFGSFDKEIDLPDSYCGVG